MLNMMVATEIKDTNGNLHTIRARIIPLLSLLKARIKQKIKLAAAF